MPSALEDLPDEAFVYLLPSRFCWPDTLHDAAWKLFEPVEPGWPRVQAVCDWVHEHIRYEAGASTAVTTAYDVWRSRTGVCRDLAQLGITLCRALNVPARYVAGYLPDIGVNTASPRWTSVVGSRSGSMAAGGRSILVTTSVGVDES